MNSGPERDLIEQGLQAQTSRRGLFRGARYAAGAGLVVVGAGALGGLDRLLVGQEKAQAASLEDLSEKPLVEEETAKIIEGRLRQLSLEGQELIFRGGNRVFNASFEYGVRNRSGLARPLGWEKVGKANYHFRDGSGNGPGLAGRLSSSSVSGDLESFIDPFGCGTEGGGWRSMYIFIDPRRTYELGWDAKKQTLESDFEIMSESSIDFFDRRRNFIPGIGSGSGLSYEDTYEQINAFKIGPGELVTWPEGARFVRIKIFAGGFQTGGSCPDGTKLAKVFCDNVYFGPPRTP